jgi:phage tail-like protein
MVARTVAEDEMQSFRFRVFEGANEAPNIFVNESPIAGFKTVTTPEITVEASEHRTGSEKFTKKFPGPPTYGEGTMTRGILRGETTIFDWLLKYLNGQPFRTTLEIKVYDQEMWGEAAADQVAIFTQTWKECFPTSVKSLGDLDSTAADVNVQEITVAVEEVEIENVAATSG